MEVMYPKVITPFAYYRISDNKKHLHDDTQV